MDNSTKNYPKVKKPVSWPWFLLGKEKDYIIENLSHLIGAGLDIISSLKLLRHDIKSPQIQKILDEVVSDIEGGTPLWKALENSRMFPAYMNALVEIGEESGKLEENLKTVAAQDERDRTFKSQVRSAMMYPVFVFTFTLVVGLGVAWFILPRLATVFSGLRMKVPWITSVFIKLGQWLGVNGSWAVPLTLVLGALLVYFVFFSPKTKFLGQNLLFAIPITRDLLLELELSRLGYLLGTLLNAGIPINSAVDSLADASYFPAYKKIYIHLKTQLEDGETFQKGLASYPNCSKYIPAPIQGMISAGEQSGTLPDVLLKIGATFSAKTENTTKNLTTLIEPVLLVIVWFGVVGVALAVFLPIYNLIGSINKQPSASSAPMTTTKIGTSGKVVPKISSSTPATSTLIMNTVTSSPVAVASSTKSKQSTIMIVILPSTTSVSVMKTPSSTSPVVGKVKAGQTIISKEFQEGWFLIPVGTTTGWINGRYAAIKE